MTHVLHDDQTSSPFLLPCSMMFSYLSQLEMQKQFRKCFQILRRGSNVAKRAIKIIMHALPTGNNLVEQINKSGSSADLSRPLCLYTAEALIWIWHDCLLRAVLNLTQDHMDPDLRSESRGSGFSARVEHRIVYRKKFVYSLYNLNAILRSLCVRTYTLLLRARVNTHCGVAFLGKFW